MKIPIGRFNEAQKSEQLYWEQRRQEISSETYRNIKRSASLEILNELRMTTNDGCLKYILEVGGAGDPMVEYFQNDFGIVIDPLARFFKTELLPEQLASVEYYSGIGEKLPFKSASFDGVLLYNCIDHGIAPFDILTESSRVLRKGGALHILVDTYSLLSNMYRMAVEKVLPARRCEEHPHGLRFSAVANHIKSLGFVEVKDCHDDHPYYRFLNDPKTSKEFIRGMAKGHRKLRAFYRLERA